MNACQWIFPRLFLVIPIAFSVEIVSLVSSGEYKTCVLIFLVMVNYDLLFIVILLRFFTSMNSEELNVLKVKMIFIAGVIAINAATIAYVILLNAYSVLLLFVGDELFNAYCEMNCMADPKAAKHIILFNIIFLLTDVTWVIRTEFFFFKQFQMYLNPDMRRFYEMAVIAEELRPSLLSEDYQLERVLRDQTCLICLSDIEEAEKIIVLECTHTFHSECLRSWIHVQVTCPSCRQVIKHSPEKQRNQELLPIRAADIVQAEGLVSAVPVVALSSDENRV